MSGVSERERQRRRRARARDRPYLVALLGLLLVVVAMAVGPLRSLSAANSRVDELAGQRDVLAAEVERLEQRREDLGDPERLRLEARRELNLVMPGDEAFVVVPDEEGRLPGEPRRAADPAEEPAPWYRRLLDAIGRLLGS